MRQFKLHEIPKGSKITGEYLNSEGIVLGTVATFHHLDGMYSYCTVDGVDGPNNIIHFSASTPLVMDEKSGSYSVDVREEPDTEEIV